MKFLKDLDFSGKKVFVRADLDVNVNSKLQTPNSNLEAVRLQNLKPTVDYLVGHKATRIIIAGHMGRPHGPNDALSTKNLLAVLQNILGEEIAFSDVFQPTGLSLPDTNSTPRVMEGAIVLLENLRFWPGEENNDADFAKQLASSADIYVNDAFAVCHRAHASIVGLPLLFSDVEDPDGVHSRRAAGLHLEEEIKTLSEVVESPQKPMVVIIGGAKIETKVPVIENLAKLADKVLIGGKLPLEIQNKGLKFAPNVDVAELSRDTKDISADSISRFIDVASSAKTVVWNGPLGLYEEGHKIGTLSVAKAIVESGAKSIIGGGETSQFLAGQNLLSGFSFVSSGGGAMLEFLAGKELPGIKALA